MNAQHALQKLLLERYHEAQRTNPKYSLRAYAKKVGVHFAALSAILNGKRAVSKKIATRIAINLALSPEESENLLSLFPEQKSKMNQRVPSLANSAQINPATDWEQFAILNLMGSKDFKSCVRWISERLHLTLTRTEQVIDKMIENQLIAKTEDGQFKAS